MISWYKMIARLLILTLFVAGLFGWYWITSQNKHPHTIYYNGQVITLDDNNRIATALSIRSGRIESVGSAADVLPFKTSATRAIDLDGKTLIPGFVDAHSHFPVGGVFAVTADLRPPPLGDINSIEKLLTTIERFAQNNDRNWVIGFGYDDSSLSERRHPTRIDIDQVISDRPVYLWHSSGHMGVANSKALELLAIDKSTRNPLGGVIVRDRKNNEPNGVLLEAAAPKMAQLLKDYQLNDYWRILRLSIENYAAAGITTAQNGSADTQLMRVLYWLQKLRLIPFRLNVYANSSTLGKALLKGQIDRHHFHNDRFAIGPVKLFADGSPQGHTAWLTQPYHSHRGRFGTSFKGFPAQSPDSLAEQMLRYHQAGFQLAIHGNGDAAIDDIISACSTLQRFDTRSDYRMVLVHGQLARPDQLLAMRDCGITPSFFSNHVYYWGDAHRLIHLGLPRADKISPAGSATDINLRYSIHTDAPVTPIDPMRLMASAVERTSLSGRIVGQRERISRLQALRAVTIDAAWQMFQEDTRGTIEVGKFADVVVLSDNPLNDAVALIDIDVLMTVVGGKTIYRHDG